ncbi:hypothetical protein GGI25_003909 [Coemansia spiralis]|uniref:Uncharacterized protein n=2 Tax=Coemansia TaxID=4863 RepID=A0A9W8G7Q4_9FUNG|nr:hypothetical protein EDC05_003644 [Coemansia umbellata]KAJ2675711.1 hypothetical protein GGI25_003909 [Coemansia spiralis]
MQQKAGHAYSHSLSSNSGSGDADAVQPDKHIENSASENIRIHLRSMHKERDHYWSAGGIPPHRERDRKHLENSSSIDTAPMLGDSKSFEAASLSAAMAASIEPAGALPESAAASIFTTSGLMPGAPADLGGASIDSVVGTVENNDSSTQRQPSDVQFISHGDDARIEEGFMPQSQTHITSQTLRNSIAGAGAGCVSSVVTCPLDVVKTRLQYQGVLHEKFRKQGYKPYSGTVNTLKRIFSEEGVRGLYRGLAPMLMGYLPTWGIYFAAYESLKHEMSSLVRTPMGPTAVHVISAMGAGATTSTLTNPIWVLKSRFMTQSAFTDYRYNSVWHAVQVIYKTEGIRGFYKGLGSSLIGVTHVAVQFPLYEHLKCWLKVDQDHHLESSRILFASALSKMVASSVTYPHEVVRTRLQNQSIAPYKYKGILHAVRLIYTEEGITAFYRGLTTNLIRTVPASMMTLLTYELLIRLI